MNCSHWSMLKPNTMKVLIILVSVLACALAVPPPKFIHPCSIKSPDFHDCVLKEAQNALPHFIKGIRSLKIPPLDPLKLPVVNLNSPNLNIKFTDLYVHGLKNAEIMDLKVEKNVGGQIELHMEHIEIISHYSMDGRILILPIKGEGAANITGIGGNYSYVAELKPYTGSDGKTYGRITHSEVKYKLKRAFFDFENLFNGDKRLGTEMNKFLNDNWEEVLNDLGIAISETISAVITSIVGNVFEAVSQDELYLD